MPTLLLWTAEFFLVVLRRLYILLTLLLRTAEIICKCSYLFCGDSTYWSNYYYVQLSFSENILNYTEERVYTVHITTMYSWVILKMFLVILRRQYKLLTLLLCTAEFYWKCSYLFWLDKTYFRHFYYVQLLCSENFLT